MEEIVCGYKKQFASKFVLDSNPCGDWMYGRFCFYINNQIIGNYNKITTLRNVKNFLQDYSENNKNKYYCPLLFDLDNKRIFDLIYNFTVENDNTISRYLSSHITPDNIHLRISDPCMDEYFIYLIENDEYTKVIYGRYNSKSILSKDQKINTIILTRGICDSVIIKTYLELKRIYKIIEPKIFGDG